MKSLAPFIVMIAILITSATCLVVIANFLLKKKIIDKGPLDQTSLQFMDRLSGTGAEVLKWSLILLFGGIGLVVLEFLPFDADSSPLPYGVEAIFVSIGFLLYYLTQRKR
jgi:hypothetical protein